MSDLPVDPLSSPFSHYPEQLRAIAEACLKNGNAPASLGYVLSSEALAVLFKLASASDSAGDGLKLLHEFQTHQIELDLQHEQNKLVERETATELARYKSLYEFAPVGYLIISHDGHILESNRTGAELLGAASNDLNGCLFESHLAPDSQAVFRWKLKKLVNGTGAESCTVHTIGKTDIGNNTMPALRVFATLAPDGDVVLLNITAMEN